jgi:hypothetical protein
MTDAAPTAAKPKFKRRWFQFGLRTLLIFVALASCGLGWGGFKLQQARQQQDAVAAIEQLGGDVVYDYEADSLGNAVPGMTPPCPAWVRALLGDDCFRSVYRITFLTQYATDSGLQHLKGLTNLKQLDLNGSPVTDAGLENLKGLTRLETLNLGEAKITDAGLKQLQELTQVRWLILERTQITDAGLVYLKGMTQLTQFSLGSTQVTDAGLESLGRMTQLQFLELNATLVTDAGLEHLKGLTNLKELNLDSTQVTAAGLAKLQKALPNCHMER